jgi:hypothetical protein
MTIAATRARHKREKSALATAHKNDKKALDNYWKGQLKTIMSQRKDALARLTSGSGWKQKSAAQKSAERGAFTRSFASNIANVKANAKSAKANMSAQHKGARASMSARHKSEIASARR